MGDGSGATNGSGAAQTGLGSTGAKTATPQADLESALRAAMTRVSAFIEDLVEMEVVTRYVVVAPGQDPPTDERGVIVARTAYSADGDIESVVPLREAVAGSGNFAFDQPLLDFHERNVAAATAYRARLLEAVIAAFPTRRR